MDDKPPIFTVIFKHLVTPITLVYHSAQSLVKQDSLDTNRKSNHAGSQGKTILLKQPEKRKAWKCGNLKRNRARRFSEMKMSVSLRQASPACEAYLWIARTHPSPLPHQPLSSPRPLPDCRAPVQEHRETQKERQSHQGCSEPTSA